MAEEAEENEIETPFKELVPHMGNAPIAPAHGIAAIALSMSMKYHNINTVKDGALYQQYKLEGKNMVPLHLDMVFADAERIETWLLGASDRIAKVVAETIVEGIKDGAFDDPQSPDEPNTNTEL